jgi:protein translocase SecG subunit
MLNITQIILAIFLTTIIILQSKGGGLGSAFGGSASYHTKRGAEKSLFALTIITCIVFVTVAFFNAVS